MKKCSKLTKIRLYILNYFFPFHVINNFKFTYFNYLSNFFYPYLKQCVLAIPFLQLSEETIVRIASYTMLLVFADRFCIAHSMYPNGI